MSVELQKTELLEANCDCFRCVCKNFEKRLLALRCPSELPLDDFNEVCYLNICQNIFR